MLVCCEVPHTRDKLDLKLPSRHMDIWTLKKEVWPEVYQGLTVANCSLNGNLS